jgi:hypothetical protein
VTKGNASILFRIEVRVGVGAYSTVFPGEENRFWGNMFLNKSTGNIFSSDKRTVRYICFSFKFSFII